MNNVEEGIFLGRIQCSSDQLAVRKVYLRALAVLTSRRALLLVDGRPSSYFQFQQIQLELFR